ncbi:hypothetical protein E2C01_066996 [Portunus trituberculatus]|uniref:Uncharacterized protein n=1 Tax=Portunus trituberculatus TaxID=210409 RepID=A0A5B7HWB1_PORTR|nr:hypothetical protein [Portunus trituberculatus]
MVEALLLLLLDVDLPVVVVVVVVVMEVEEEDGTDLLVVLKWRKRWFFFYIRGKIDQEQEKP